MSKPNTFRAGVDENGHFGIYGGRYVAETLMPLILAVEQAYTEARADDDGIVVRHGLALWSKGEVDQAKRRARTSERGHQLVGHRTTAAPRGFGRWRLLGPTEGVAAHADT